jgi:hypothetical protein
MTTLANCVVRNDIDRLKRIGILAAAWYGRRRSAVNIVQRDYVTAVNPGNLMINLLAGSISTAVNTVITEVVWNFRSMQTEIVTSYFELEWIDK